MKTDDAKYNLADAQMPLDLGHRPALGRADYLVAPSNETAVAWIDRWPDWPGAVLALYGPAGSGKSHLAAVWRAASGALKVDSNMLAKLAEAAFAPTGRAAVVEDVEGHLATRPDLQRGLLHLHNLIRERGGHLLLTGRQAPARWSCPLADLASRLAAAPAVRLGAPDDGLIHAVLVKLFADRQLKANAEVIAFLLSRMERSFAAARAIVEALDAASLAARRPVSVPLARAVLDRLNDHEAP